ncbi:MAG: M23/M56 family metallopeptidase [Carboxylicivirga sp.]|jgi:murein DD-endopeptidase MepM/ murein hydrolase activator NlpD|nr:M23/M56 family metallopeptidase [Carboxylicivirga sp.]
MDVLLGYLIKSSVVSGIFYLIYHLTLRNESFFTLSRMYLLTSVVFAYLFPFIKIDLTTYTSEPTTIINAIHTTVNQFTFMEEPMINNEVATSLAPAKEYWWLIPLVMVSFAFLFRFLKNIIHLWKTIRANEKINHKKFTLVLFNQHYTFSFFRYIFISQNVWHSPNGNSIIDHELSHLRHKHSLDRMFMEVLLIIFWMNPFIYLYRKALEEVHEFQADADATQNSPLKDYFNLVLQQASHNHYSPLMSPFSYKLIKKRIKMANYKSNPVKRLLVALPFIVALLIIFGSATISQNTITHSNEKNYAWPSDNRAHNTIIVDMYKQNNASSLVTINEKAALKQNNVLPILINAKGQMLVNGNPGNVKAVKSSVKSFMSSTKPINGNSPVIFLKKDVDTSYDLANLVLTEVNSAITDLRNTMAKESFNTSFSNCSVEQKMEIEKAYPIQIVIAPSKHVSNKSNDESLFHSPIRKEDLNKVSSGFGMRKHPISKKMKMHNGVDYVAPLNTKVMAIGDGVVRKVNLNFEVGKGHGRFVIVDHENGYSSLYSQLNAYKVKEGQKVKQGDVIGLLGSSGISTGPHLHLEIKKDGHYVDPESLIN